MIHHSFLDVLPEALRRETLDGIKVATFPPGASLFRAGDQCQGLPLVLNGSIKVQITGTSGNGIVLYRMVADDICTLSIGCLMTGHGYRAEAVVEEAAEAAMVSREVFERLMDQSSAFRRGVMQSYGQRLDDLMLLVEEVAFRRMDQRLEECLCGRSINGSLNMTHQALAEELGTAREVVSRLLKEMERQGKIKLSRGCIVLTEKFGRYGT